ncbi:MAG TPA: ABC transporter ATP-binding protein [Tepidisphaeraceae bacterium]|nr:ABC transporter ATP-binding protein [Tepidisphaeraceae bacterium]
MPRSPPGNKSNLFVLLLQLHNISLQFGGVTALRDFAFDLNAGELVGLIGPNGAGKTTAFNIVTGVYRPTAGSVTMNGRRIDGLPPHRISRLGLARTFQNIRLFGGLSVLDNVLVGFAPLSTHGLAQTVLRLPGHLREVRQFEARAMQLLDTFGLAARFAESAASLPYGDQRRLEIARALATDPKVLLLDEPAAGMNPQEKIELTHLIALLRDRFGVGIWLIEHDMKLVMSICQRITVLDHGETIAIGTPEEVRNDPKVIGAYLGEPAGSETNDISQRGACQNASEA